MVSRAAVAPICRPEAALAVGRPVRGVAEVRDAPRSARAVVVVRSLLRPVGMPLFHALSRSVLVLVIATLVACIGEMPPPPELQVTSPERGLVAGDAGRVMVEGKARPGPTGAAVTRVEVNDVRATLAADGSFSAVVDLSDGATLLATRAIASDGGVATDVRAVHVGEVRPIGSNIERAVTASLSAEAFARLATAAGPIVRSLDFGALLAPLQPMANLGDSLANVKLSVTGLSLGDVRFTLVPAEGGLQFSAELTAFDAGALAAYGGALVIDGSTTIHATADRVTISGTLVVTPAGTAGFTVAIAAPRVTTANLRLRASGLAGDILDLIQDNLASTVAGIATRSAERGLAPLINQALGALAGEQRFDVLGRQLALQASPAAIAFSPAGALVTLDLATTIGGSEGGAGYVFTPNGTPTLDVGAGVQVGLADDLVNELLAEVHAIGLLDLHLDADVGVFDTVDITPSLPPMVSASGGDGALRLVLGDMIASFRDDGVEVIRAALNAQVDLQVQRGQAADEIALEFGKVRLYVNLIDTGAAGAADGITDTAAAGIALQLDSLTQFLIKVPVPSVAGVTLDRLALHADDGYVVMSGELH